MSFEPAFERGAHRDSRGPHALFRPHKPLDFRSSHEGLRFLGLGHRALGTADVQASIGVKHDGNKTTLATGRIRADVVGG